MSKTNVSVQVINRWLEETNENLNIITPIGNDIESVKEVGKIIVDSPNLQNDFCSWLINRIGKTKIWSSMWENPLSFANKGLIEYGDSIEEIFVDICRPYQYSASVGDREVFRRIQPNIKSAFHIVNTQLFYKSSTAPMDIRKAFLSMDGVENLTKRIIGVMITSEAYDTYLLLKYMIAKAALDGTTNMKNITAITDKSTADAALEVFKEESNNMEFLSRNFNTLGVANSATKDRQYLVLTNKAEAKISVQSLAYMFGVGLAESENKKIRVDSFSFTDEEIERIRYALCPKDNATGEPIEEPTSEDFAVFTSDELTALGNIQAVLLDDEWFQVYTQLFETRYIQNPQNMWENNWLHVWKIYSRSPFANCEIFHSNSNSITVAIDDETVPTVTAGTAGSQTIDVALTFSGLKPKNANNVIWTVANGEGATGKATIDQNGKLTWTDAYTAADTITVTCKSAIDNTAYDTATITVEAAQ